MAQDVSCIHLQSRIRVDSGTTIQNIFLAIGRSHIRKSSYVCYCPFGPCAMPDVLDKMKSGHSVQGIALLRYSHKVFE